MALFSSSNYAKYLNNLHSSSASNTTFSTTKFTWNNGTVGTISSAPSTGTFTLNPDGSTTWEPDPVSKDGISERDGYLVCPCGETDVRNYQNYQACTHVHEWIRTMNDGIVTGTQRVIVPLFSDKIEGHALNAPILVEWEERNAADMASFWLVGNTANYRLGWLSEGEGRKAIRLVLLEWLRSMYYSDDLGPCPFHGHNNYLLSSTERQKKDLTSSAQTVIAGVASLIMYRSCWRCYTGSQVIDDLTPDI